MLYQAAVFIHILSAIVWAGGMLFLVMVMVPLARQAMRDGGPGAVLLQQAARRFLPVAWSAIALLVLTGIYIAWSHWGVRPDNFFTGGGQFIRVLQIKVGLTLLVIVLSLAHDFVIGPLVLRKLEATPSPGDAGYPRRGRALVLVLARMNLLLVMAILVLAVVLVRP